MPGENRLLIKPFYYETALDLPVPREFRDTTSRANEIQLDRFKAVVYWQDWVIEVGYGPDNLLSRDWYVRYFSSRYDGRRCYLALRRWKVYIFTEQCHAISRPGHPAYDFGARI